MMEDDIFFGSPKKKDDEPEYYDPPTGPIFNINIGGCLPATILIIILLALGYFIIKEYGYKVVEPEKTKENIEVRK